MLNKATHNSDLKNYFIHLILCYLNGLLINENPQLFACSPMSTALVIQIFFLLNTTPLLITLLKIQGTTSYNDVGLQEYDKVELLNLHFTQDELSWGPYDYYYTVNDRF